MRRDLFAPSVVVLAAMLAGFVAAAAAQEKPQEHQQQPQQQATKVNLDDLEKHPEQYLGKTVMVEGKVAKILGPHLFTVDQPKWIDLGREMPVVVPDPFAAIVQKDARVMVTGKVEKVPLARVEQEPGLRDEEKLRVEIETKPVLVANELTAIQSGVVLRVRADQPVGTSGKGGPAAVTDPNQLAQAQPKDVVGKRVELNDVTVAGTTAHGFWINTPGGKRIFVQPTEKSKASVKDGQHVSIHGTVLEMPEGLKKEVKGDSSIYIYADHVEPK